jgi:histone deacetylase 6
MGGKHSSLPAGFPPESNQTQTDGVTRYIDWAIEKGFGVIDVNVPHYVTHPEVCILHDPNNRPSPILTQPQDTEAFTPRADERAIQAQVQELMCYIWDNYLQLYDGVDDIFLMGVGNAYLGVKVLLINRLDVKARVAGVVNFVNGSLRPVKSDVDGDLSSWYKEHSQVYVANDHACWSDPDLTRKVMKRRFGNVIRAQVNGLTPMMAEHFADVQQFVMERVTEEGDGEGMEGGDTTEDENKMG